MDSYAVGLLFGYGLIAAIVVGSLLASHTLLGSRVVAELGANRLELIDDRMLHVVLVLMFITATLGPVLTQYVAPYMLRDYSTKEALNA